MSNKTMTQNEAVAAFYNTLPDGATWDDLAKGVTAILPNGEKMNTCAGPYYATRSMPHYIKGLERRACKLLGADYQDPEEEE